jgi:hypothetical protein
MCLPLFALVLFFAGAEPQPARTVHNNVITSAGDPAIKLEVSDDLKYLGFFPFDIKSVAGGQRHLWVKADKNKRIQRLFILQFEGYYPSQTYRYNYKPRNVVRLGANDYNSNGFFYDDTEYHKEHPGSEAELTRKFLEERGYKFDAEQLLFRFYRSLPDPDPAKDHRNEFLIFYIEPMKELGITMKETTEEQQTEREKKLVAAARERALKTFKVLEN